MRYTDGVTATDYTYTGQYSQMDDVGLMFHNARWYDPYLNRWTQPDTIVPDPTNPQSLDRYSYSFNNPVRYNDPTGHKPCWATKHYTCNLRPKDLENLGIKYPELLGFGWTTDEMSAIYQAWGLLYLEFGGQKALENALGGVVSFLHVPAGLLGEKIVARSNETLNMIFVDSAQFQAQDKKVWYVLHEIGHIFDMNGSQGNPKQYKSSAFVDAFIPGGCTLNWHGCTGSQWQPTDLNTTDYGRSDGSVEDFAESFASTVLYNHDMEAASFRNVGQSRMNIINVWISLYVGGR